MEGNDPVPKTLEEMAWHHDLLDAILEGEVDMKLTYTSRLIIGTAKGVLCWCMGHADSAQFAVMMEELHNAVAAGGYRTRRAHKPTDPPCAN